MVRPVRVAIVSDDPLTRSGVAALLDATGDVVVIPVAAERGGDLELAGADVALVDVAASADALRTAGAAAPIVALIRDDVQAADALASGARAVVFRNSSADQLVAALLAAHRGLIAVDAALGGWIRAPARAAAESDTGLTPREAEVLKLLAQGLSNKSIAQRLGVSDRTAKFHVESILAKLGAESRSEAIVIAARRGMVTL